MAGTLLRLGCTDPRTGAFGAHPQLGGPLDLNDGVTYTLLDETLEIAPPPRELALSGNVRASGERGLRALYRHNRRAAARLIIGPMASASDLAAVIRALSAWVAAPPALPVTLLWQAPGAASPVYLDVVGMASDIPTSERDWLRLQSEPVTLLLITRPGMRGDRVTLSNLAMNPGFEAPSGPGVMTFSDSFANLNAYTTVTTPAPTLAASQMTLATNTLITFGSPAWGAINTWTVRLQYATGENLQLLLHYVDINNHLLCRFQSGANGFQMAHRVGGTYNALSQATVTLTAGNWYWLQITQFPSVASNPPLVGATLANDSAGAIGTVVATLAPAATFDAVTALSGVAGLRCVSGPAVIGGAFSGVHTLALFGPGGWTFEPQSSGASPSGIASGAWEQDTSKTYGGGPVASFGAARLDLPPAGMVDCGWRLYAGGSPVGALGAIPISAPGATLQVSAWARSSGLAANAALRLEVAEFDGGGAQLRATTVATLNGNQATWARLAGSVTTGASCAYADLRLRVVDTAVAGESATATVWFDNAQVWDQTATGMASMPYCELRFPQSPAQLLVSGLLGDLPSPAMVALGTYVTAMALGTALQWALGRRGQASQQARMTGVPLGFQSPNTGLLAPAISSALDASSYGGYYLATTLGAGFNPRVLGFIAPDLLGVYHLFDRAWSAESVGNLPSVQHRVVTQQRSQPWFGLASGADQIGTYNGPWSSPIAAASTWTVSDAGQMNVPALPQGAMSDPTQLYLTPRGQWQDLAGSAAFRSGWQALIPVDGSLLLGVTNNPANNSGAVTASWLWQYIDGLLTTRGGPSDGPACTYSVESAALAAPAHSGGGPGTQSTGSINVNLGADPYLTLDPAQAAVSSAAGGGSSTAAGDAVNQLAGFITDSAGAVLPLACDLVYTPLYLYPR